MVIEAAVEFLWWVVSGGVDVQSHFHVQSNYSVEVVLCCVVVGVMTKNVVYSCPLHPCQPTARPPTN